MQHKAAKLCERKPQARKKKNVFCKIIMIIMTVNTLTCGFQHILASNVFVETCNIQPTTGKTIQVELSFQNRPR